MEWRLNAGAGGFGRTCQNVPTAGGYYLCMGGFGGNIIFGIKPTADGLDIKNYGYATWRGDQLNGSLIGSGQPYVSPFSSATNYPLWDDELPGVFYMTYLWSGGGANGKMVLVKLTMDLVEKTVSDKDASTDPIFGSNRAPKVGITSAVILTPCLDTCDGAEDDFTMTAQRILYSARWDGEKSDFVQCALQAVQGLTVIEVCTSAGPDSYAWTFVYDLGNRSPIGSGFTGTQSGNTMHVYGGFPTHDTPSCRWCALHTYQSPSQIGGATWANLEMARCN